MSGDSRVTDKDRFFAKTISDALANGVELGVIAQLIADIRYAASDEAYRAGVLSTRQVSP